MLWVPLLRLIFYNKSFHGVCKKHTFILYETPNKGSPGKSLKFCCGQEEIPWAGNAGYSLGFHGPFGSAAIEFLAFFVII